MRNEERFSEELLCTVLLVGVMFGIVAGAAIYASAYPIFQSEKWAAWVQAIGSVVAIYFAARIGRKQAKTAFDIHSLDVTQRAKERRKDLVRQGRVDAARATEEKENALAEAAVHRVAVKRINLQIISIYRDVDVAVKNIEREREALSKLEEKRTELLSSSGSDELRNVSKDIDITKEHLSRAEACLARYALDLEETIKKLTELPRSVIRVASGKLADQVTSTINGLQDAVLEIEHSRGGGNICKSITRADQHLRRFLAELGALLAKRERY